MWKDRINPRLASQLSFLIEIDRLKLIVRGNRIADGSRRENTAEHSWHLAMFAAILSEWAVPPVNLPKVIQMLLLHDLIEIEAGDTPLFESGNGTEQAVREQEAAAVVFGHLPSDQASELRTLWEEFEASSTSDARFAKSLDRLQPILLNYLAKGGTWLDYQVDEDREREMTKRIELGAPALWHAAQEVFAEAVREGWLLPGKTQA